MAENAQAHFHDCNEKLTDHEIKKVLRGQIYAFFIAMLGIAAAVTCGFIGQTIIGSIAGGATLIALIPNFISGREKSIDTERFTRKPGNPFPIQKETEKS